MDGVCAQVVVVEGELRLDVLYQEGLLVFSLGRLERVTAVSSFPTISDLQIIGLDAYGQPTQLDVDFGELRKSGRIELWGETESALLTPLPRREGGPENDESATV